MPRDLRAKIEELVQEYSSEAIFQELRLITRGDNSSILTIIANAGLHSVPTEFLRGDVYNFSEGTIQLSPDQAEITIKNLCFSAGKFLKKQRWEKIYIIPTGHPLLIATITLLVFRITRINPIIVAYFGEEGYRDISIDIRSSLIR